MIGFRLRLYRERVEQMAASFFFLGRGRRAEFRSRPAVLMECRPSDYNGRYCKDGSGGVGHIPRPTSEMLIPDPNRERNRKENEDGAT
jgi:hypothetical protein